MNEAKRPRRALAVIDVQLEYFSGALKISYPPADHSLANIVRAMDHAHSAGIPVVVVQQTSAATAPAFARDSATWQLHPAVAQRAHDYRLEKTLPSAFAGTDLADWLARNGIDTLVVAGFMTHNCDAATIFDALNRGLQVEFLRDASGSLPYSNRAGHVTGEVLHRAFSVVFQSRFAAVLGTDEWIDAVRTGTVPERDNILASHRRALNN